MKAIQHTATITEIQDFWNDGQCLTLINRGEEGGFEKAMIQTDRGEREVPGVRNNQRFLFEDIELAQSIYEASREWIPQRLGNSEAIGLNELFRLYKYEPGQHFRKHRDQSYIHSESRMSFYTLMIYLNDDFTGGETTFNDISIKPVRGSCLIFLHDLEHAGTAITSGTKYVLRNDVMYRLSGF